jgi:hypothetical protein
MTQRHQLLHKSLTHVGRAAVVAVAALLLALLTALPAQAQARNTRPPDTPTAAPSGSSGSSSAGSSGSSSSAPAPVAGRSSGSSGQSTASRGRGRGSGDRARVTRPPSGSRGGGVISNDTRYRRYPGQRGVYHDPYYSGRYRYYDPYWSPYRFSWWLGYDGWYGWNGWGVGWGAYPYYPYAHYPPVVYYPSQVRPDMGALDLDLKPGNTQIYVNGQLIGIADDFDGWPQYLWLESGDYHFIFYRQDRQPIVREYKILSGVVIDVEDRLQRGEAPPVESLFPPPTERRDERIRSNAEQRARVEAERAADWRQRSEAIRRHAAGEGMEDGRATGDFGSLLLAVDPSDASVYLDGRFLGTGEDITRLRRGLTVDAGEHTLSVVRPGYEGEEVEINVDAGEQVEVSVRLDPK